MKLANPYAKCTIKQITKSITEQESYWKFHWCCYHNTYLLVHFIRLDSYSTFRRRINIKQTLRTLPAHAVVLWSTRDRDRQVICIAKGFWQWTRQNWLAFMVSFSVSSKIQQHGYFFSTDKGWGFHKKDNLRGKKIQMKIKLKLGTKLIHSTYYRWTHSAGYNNRLENTVWSRCTI